MPTTINAGANGAGTVLPGVSIESDDYSDDGDSSTIGGSSPSASSQRRLSNSPFGTPKVALDGTTYDYVSSIHGQLPSSEANLEDHSDIFTPPSPTISRLENIAEHITSANALWSAAKAAEAAEARLASAALSPVADDSDEASQEVEFGLGITCNQTLADQMKVISSKRQADAQRAELNRLQAAMNTARQLYDAALAKLSEASDASSERLLQQYQCYQLHVVFLEAEIACVIQENVIKNSAENNTRIEELKAAAESAQQEMTRLAQLLSQDIRNDLKGHIAVLGECSDALTLEINKEVDAILKRHHALGRATQLMENATLAMSRYEQLITNMARAGIDCTGLNHTRLACDLAKKLLERGKAQSSAALESMLQNYLNFAKDYIHQASQIIACPLAATDSIADQEDPAAARFRQVSTVRCEIEQWSREVSELAQVFPDQVTSINDLVRGCLSSIDFHINTLQTQHNIELNRLLLEMQDKQRVYDDARGQLPKESDLSAEYLFQQYRCMLALVDFLNKKIAYLTRSDKVANQDAIAQLIEQRSSLCASMPAFLVHLKNTISADMTAQIAAVKVLHAKLIALLDDTGDRILARNQVLMEADKALVAINASMAAHQSLIASMNAASIDCTDLNCVLSAYTSAKDDFGQVQGQLVAVLTAALATRSNGIAQQLTAQQDDIDTALQALDRLQTEAGSITDRTALPAKLALITTEIAKVDAAKRQIDQLLCEARTLAVSPPNKLKPVIDAVIASAEQYLATKNDDIARAQVCEQLLSAKVAHDLNTQVKRDWTTHVLPHTQDKVGFGIKPNDGIVSNELVKTLVITTSNASTVNVNSTADGKSANLTVKIPATVVSMR